MLKLKLQYFGHLMWRANSLEKTLMPGKIEAGGEGNDRGWDGWMTSLNQWTWVWANSRRYEGQGSLVCCSPWGCKESYTLSDWTTRRELKILPESNQGDKETKNMKVTLRERKEKRTGLNRYLMRGPKVEKEKGDWVQDSLSTLFTNESPVTGVAAGHGECCVCMCVCVKQIA